MQTVAFLLMAFAFAAPGPAFGFSDDTGDTDPVITVRGGRFVVTFRNTVKERAKPLWYSTEIDATGAFIERRVPLVGEDAVQAERLHWSGRERSRLPEGTGELSLKGIPGERGSPYFVRIAPGRPPERIDLAWGETRVEDVRSFAASAQEFVLVTDPGLSMHRFDRHGAGHASVRIGDSSNVCFHHCWPKASTVLALGDRFVVAWVAKDESVKLTWWSPRDGKLVTKQLAARVDTKAVSLAAIGDAVLVTYSEPGNPGAPVPPEGHAVIRYVFLKELPGE